MSRLEDRLPPKNTSSNWYLVSSLHDVLGNILSFIEDFQEKFSLHMTLQHYDDSVFFEAIKLLPEGILQSALCRLSSTNPFALRVLKNPFYHATQGQVALKIKYINGLLTQYNTLDENTQLIYSKNAHEKFYFKSLIDRIQNSMRDIVYLPWKSKILYGALIITAILSAIISLYYFITRFGEKKLLPILADQLITKITASINGTARAGIFQDTQISHLAYNTDCIAYTEYWKNALICYNTGWDFPPNIPGWCNGDPFIYYGVSLWGYLFHGDYFMTSTDILGSMHQDMIGGDFQFPSDLLWNDVVGQELLNNTQDSFLLDAFIDANYNLSSFLINSLLLQCNIFISNSTLCESAKAITIYNYSASYNNSIEQILLSNQNTDIDFWIAGPALLNAFNLTLTCAIGQNQYRRIIIPEAIAGAFLGFSVAALAVLKITQATPCFNNTPELSDAKTIGKIAHSLMLFAYGKQRQERQRVGQVRSMQREVHSGVPGPC